MEEKKRYAWLDIYKTRNNTVLYDKLEITEPYNEFFEGILKINPSPEIRRFYITSLHLIGFLTIQKRLRKKMSNRIPLSLNESIFMGIKSNELFWNATEKIPKPFIFTSLPALTMPKEFYKNILEIAVELIKIKKMTSPTHTAEVQATILERMLVNNEIRSKNSFVEDGFTSNDVQPVFKMFLKMKENSIADSFYRHYEMSYFLNMYYRERQETATSSILLADIQFLDNHSVKEISMEGEAEEYERRIKDRKFILIMHAIISKFAKNLQISKRIENYAVNILHTLLQKEELLGYFEDFSAEIIIVGISYISMKVHKKEISVREVFENYRALGFISSFREAKYRTVISVDEIVRYLLVNTYNTLLPAIMKNLKIKNTPAEATQTKEAPAKLKYMLSPLPGRMSQIVKVPENTKKVLFAEKRV